MVSKIETFKTLDDFKNLGRRIATGVANSMELIQMGTTAAMEHIEAHGNVAVLEPIAAAVGSYMSKTLALKWKAWAIAHSWFTFNPNDLKGSKLGSATFAQVWVKTKGKAMNLDGMRSVKWFNYEPEKDVKPDAPVDINKLASKLAKQVQQAIEAGLLVGNDGKTRVSAHEARTILKAAVETLVETHKVTVQDKATKVAKRRNATKVREEMREKIQAVKDQPPVAAAA